MNTDMVPNGQRDDIEDIELNHVIARIAGKQFFYWIKQLIESKNTTLTLSLHLSQTLMSARRDACIRRL